MRIPKRSGLRAAKSFASHVRSAGAYGCGLVCKVHNWSVGRSVGQSAEHTGHEEAMEKKRTLRRWPQHFRVTFWNALRKAGESALRRCRRFGSGRERGFGVFGLFSSSKAIDRPDDACGCPFSARNGPRTKSTLQQGRFQVRNERCGQHACLAVKCVTKCEKMEIGLLQVSSFYSFSSSRSSGSFFLFFSRRSPAERN